MAEYEGRLPLFHQDLYRLAGTSEALEGGLLDERQDDGVTLSEWADRLDAALDGDRVTVRIEPVGETDRRIEVFGAGDAGRRYVAAAETHRDRRGRGPVSEDRHGRLGSSSRSTRPRTTASSRSRPVPARSARASSTWAVATAPRCSSRSIRLLGDAGLRPAERRAHRRGHGPGLLHGPARRSATAKTIAYVPELRSSAWPRPMRSDRPRVAARVAGPEAVVVLPAGAHDHYLAARRRGARAHRAGRAHGRARRPRGDRGGRAGGPRRRGGRRDAARRPSRACRMPSWRSASALTRRRCRRRRHARARLRGAAAGHRRAAGDGMVARPPLTLRVEPMRLDDIPPCTTSSAPASRCRGRLRVPPGARDEPPGALPRRPRRRRRSSPTAASG